MSKIVTSTEELEAVERILRDYLDETAECTKVVHEIQLFETKVATWLQAAGIAGEIVVLWVLFA